MGDSYRILDDGAIERIVAEGLASMPVSGKRVLVIVPDLTRTMPLPLFFRLIVQYLRPRVRTLDFLVALGTHPPLDEAALNRLFGLAPHERASSYADIRLINHAWKTPESLVSLGAIPAHEIAQLSDGLLHMSVPVRINRLVMEYDHLLVCGPVFPHEVAGFSGGNKYFFPGISGPDVIDATHWLGALMTSNYIIGTKDTPVRQVINRAASLIPRPKYDFCCVVSTAGVHGVFFGDPETAFDQAAEVSAKVHIRTVKHPYKRVLSLLPEMYDDMWVGAKGMYKVEPVVADGGEVILYGPHISELSRSHEEMIRQVGYHVRDYFVAQWDRFKDYPWGILAHSTHLKGAGTYVRGIELPRIAVTLATSIPEAVCHAVNLGYSDPHDIDIAAELQEPNDDLLVVPHAGEMLYRL